MKNPIIYPILISLMPILFLYQDNMREIPIQDIVTPLVLSIAITFVSWFILKYFFNIRKVSVGISFIIILLIIFSHVRIFFANNEDMNLQFIGSNIILMPIILSVGIIGFIFLYKKNIPTETTSIFNVMAIVVILFIGSQLTIYFINDDSQISSFSEFVKIPIIQSDVVDKPDVYLLVLDAYSGDITLERDYNFDNSKYKNELRDRGFVVQDYTYSNYPNTNLSMPSIMNMVYLDSIAERLGGDSRDVTGMREIRNENNAMKIFKENDYNIITFFAGANAAASKELIDERLCGSFLDLSPELQRAFVYMYFPLSYTRALFFDNYQYDRLECTFSTVLNFDKKDDNPLYMHIHILLPHPPFVFNSDGERVEHKYTKDIFDASLRDAYLEQTIFANKITIEMIDSIQQRDDSAVIIVMSDHGGRLGVNWDNPTEMDYYRALNNISAFYFPGHEGDIPEKIASVNTYRVLFNTYFNTDYEILEDRQMWYVPERPWDQTDVTEKLLKN